MKQTLEEAAKIAIHINYNCNGDYPCSEREYCEHCNGHNTAFDCCECGADEFKDGFIAGAEWQEKQSPWISNEEPANIYDDFLVTTGKEVYKAYCNGRDCNGNNKWYISDRLDKKRIEGVIAYMPIPSFDDILEANKDVLERIKEKGE